MTKLKRVDLKELESGDVHEDWIELNHKELIYDIFNENPILFHTSLEKLDKEQPLQNHRFVNETYSFYKYYREKLEELFDREWEKHLKEYVDVLEVFKELEKENKIIQLKDIPEVQKWKDREKLKKIRNINNIFKARRPVWKEHGGLFDLKYKGEREVTEFVRGLDARDNVKKVLPVRPALYILKTRRDEEGMLESINPYNLLVETITEIKTGERVVVEKRIMLRKTDVEKQRQILARWKDELETFEEQILKSDIYSVFDNNLKDLVNFMDETFHRTCPRCRADVFDPMHLSREELKEYDKYYESYLNGDPIDNEDMLRYVGLKRLQELYLMDFDHASQTADHPLYREKKKTMNTWKDSLITLKEKGIDRQIGGFTCPNEGCEASIMKSRLLHVRGIIVKILLAVEANFPVALYGYPECDEVLTRGYETEKVRS